MRERQSQKEINQKKVRRTWRLAAAAKLWEVAYDSICEEKMKASCKQFDRDEALECGETFFFGSEGLEAPLHELADASFETMKRRMELDQAPEWSWQANHAWFAVRSWGAIVWKWVMQTLAASCCELLSIGSCGAGAGQALLDRMLATIAAQHEGVIYVILKSRAAAESFWEGQAFTSLTSIFSDATPPQWFVNCPGCVQRILKRYREESGLKTFVRLVQGKRRHIWILAQLHLARGLQQAADGSSSMLWSPTTTIRCQRRTSWRATLLLGKPDSILGLQASQPRLWPPYVGGNVRESWIL